jgi:hypothetical protein
VGGLDRRVHVWVVRQEGACVGAGASRQVCVHGLRLGWCQACPHVWEQANGMHSQVRQQIGSFRCGWLQGSNKQVTIWCRVRARLDWLTANKLNCPASSGNVYRIKT